MLPEFDNTTVAIPTVHIEAQLSLQQKIEIIERKRAENKGGMHIIEDNGLVDPSILNEHSMIARIKIAGFNGIEYNIVTDGLSCEIYGFDPLTGRHFTETNNSVELGLVIRKQPLNFSLKPEFESNLIEAGVVNATFPQGIVLKMSVGSYK